MRLHEPHMYMRPSLDPSQLPAMAAYIPAPAAQHCAHAHHHSGQVITLLEGPDLARCIACALPRSRPSHSSLVAWVNGNSAVAPHTVICCGSWQHRQRPSRSTRCAACSRRAPALAHMLLLLLMRPHCCTCSTCQLRVGSVFGIRYCCSGACLGVCAVLVRADVCGVLNVPVPAAGVLAVQA
jgi:hypothetical protein